MNRKFFTTKLIVLLALLLTVGGVAAQGPRSGEEFRTEPVERDTSIAAIVDSVISYQGVLKESGNPANGTRDMVFRFYTQSDCSGTAVETVTKNGVQVTDGLFSEELDVTQANFDGQELWLAVEVEGTAIGCREIMPVPYALSLRPGATIKSTAGTGLLVQSSDTVQYTVALQGRASGSSGVTYGVIGQTMSESNWAVGVYGQALGSTGINAGVAGRNDSSSNGAKGVSGGTTATSGDTYGVYGTSDSSSGTGVYGESDTGVHGKGVCGVLGETTGLGAGVRGVGGSAGFGVWAANDEGIALQVSGGTHDYAAVIDGGDLVVSNGYLNLPTISGSDPPSGDCNENWEEGRMIVRTDTGELFICADSGWVSK
jgi:hypothetical protein